MLNDYGAGAVHRLSNRSIPQISSALPGPTPDFRCQAFPKGKALAFSEKSLSIIKRAVSLEGQPLDDERDWRLLLQSRHEGVALHRLAALSLGEKCAGSEVRPGVYFLVDYDDAVAFLDAADNLRDATVIAPEVAEFFISEDE